jgi:large subunit ribosomal protein L3
MKFILGKKIEMAQIFDEKGNVVPITLLEAGPCFVLQSKTDEKDGYKAFQFGFTPKTKNIKKTEKNKEYKVVREFRDNKSEMENYELGQKVDLSIFKEGQEVNISGISKGRGFAGGVKKWHFAGRPSTHGTKHQERTIGSVGCRYPQRVIKGKHMPGRLGYDRVTLKNCRIAKLDIENNILAVRGSVPGRRGTLLEIRG